MFKILIKYNLLLGKDYINKVNKKKKIQKIYYKF